MRKRAGLKRPTAKDGSETGFSTTANKREVEKRKMTHGQQKKEPRNQLHLNRRGRPGGWKIESYYLIFSSDRRLKYIFWMLEVMQDPARMNGRATTPLRGGKGVGEGE